MTRPASLVQTHTEKELRGRYFRNSVFTGKWSSPILGLSSSISFHSTIHPVPNFRHEAANTFFVQQRSSLNPLPNGMTVHETLYSPIILQSSPETARLDPLNIGHLAGDPATSLSHRHEPRGGGSGGHRPEGPIHLVDSARLKTL